MTRNQLEHSDPSDSLIDRTPLKNSRRSDWHVKASPQTTRTPAVFTDTDVFDQLRVFFDQLEAEATARKDDPVAMVNVLARMEVLLADMRSATASIRKHAADALIDNDIRRITIDGVATVEATSTSDRTDWQDQRLLADMLTFDPDVPRLVDVDTGAVVDNDALAEAILRWGRVQWRMTPIRELGLDPDNYSTQPKTEDGKPLRTPTIRMQDNTLRKQQIVQTGSKVN